jgi:hypothetical protein
MEMGGFIYKMSNGSYGYLQAGSNPSSHHLELDPRGYYFPEGSTIVATYHTHPALFTEEGNFILTEEFSREDLEYGINHHVDMYLGTYNGTFAYTGSNGSQQNLYNTF